MPPRRMFRIQLPGRASTNGASHAWIRWIRPLSSSAQFRFDEKRGYQLSRIADTAPRVVPEARHEPAAIRRELNG